MPATNVATTLLLRRREKYYYLLHQLHPNQIPQLRRPLVVLNHIMHAFQGLHRAVRERRNKDGRKAFTEKPRAEEHRFHR